MSKPRILIQLDGDAHASVFDAVVAVDSQVDHLLQYQDVRPEQVRGLVHGAMFTRGPKDLHRTAIFVGGSDVLAGETLLKEVTASFFGPMRVSVMLDANGANTTAAAAVLAAARHVELAQATVLVLAATGPVGRRAARLLSRQGTRVRVASRTQARADEVCGDLQASRDAARLEAVQTATAQEALRALEGADAVIAAGAAGVELLPAEALTSQSSLKVAIDLNAVPPAGIPGIEVTDAAAERSGVTCYGAIGVGGTKMKIHKAAIQRLFVDNNQVLDAEQIFAIGQELDDPS
jgi:hypothetical protein